jgi:hypothetical protein
MGRCEVSGLLVSNNAGCTSVERSDMIMTIYRILIFPIIIVSSCSSLGM